jgi:hypothetical protein
MTLTERLDQFDLAGQMILVIWTAAMQFIQQFGMKNFLSLIPPYAETWPAPSSHPLPCRQYA